MLKPKLLLLVFSTLILQIITAQTSFNKKFFLGAGGQLSIYNGEKKYIDMTQRNVNLKEYYTTYGLGMEFGYFIIPNLSVSLKSTFQEWSVTSNYGFSPSYKESINSFHNGILFNKMLPLKNGLFFSVGAMPFYEKIFHTPSRILFGNTDKSESRTNHGAVFNFGFAFAIAQNSILNVGVYRKFDALQMLNENVKSGLTVSYKYVFNNHKNEDIELKENTVYEPQKRKLSLLLGGNINNPHKLLEGGKSYTDYSSYADGIGNSYGNLFLALLYKNKWQLSLQQELMENTFLFYATTGTDYYLNARYYVLNDSFAMNPYLEVGTILGTISNDVNEQKSVQLSSGFIYQLNAIIGLDFGLSLQYRELDITYRTPGSPIKEMDISYNRFMVKTGLIFKIL